MRSVPERARNGNEDVIDEVRRALERAVKRAASSEAFADVERVALEIGNEAIRRMLEAALQVAADREPDVVELGGDTYRRHEVGSAKYHSLCGPIFVVRATYRRVGMRNGPTIVALDLREGMIERASPALARVVARGYAKDSMRNVRADLVAAHRQPPSRSTLERMAKAIGLSAKKQLPTIERSIRAREVLPDEAVAVTLGLDRTSVPMEELDDAPNAARPRVCVRYRMAYVGTVTLTNRRCEKVHAWRYAVPAHQGPDGLVRRMMDDLDRALKQKPDLQTPEKASST